MYCVIRNITYERPRSLARYIVTPDSLSPPLFPLDYSLHQWIGIQVVTTYCIYPKYIIIFENYSIQSYTHTFYYCQ